MAQQKFSHSSLNPIFSFIPLTLGMPIATRIVTYGEVFHIHPSILPFCIVYS
jgi:hypothetical protein